MPRQLIDQLKSLSTQLTEPTQRLIDILCVSTRHKRPSNPIFPPRTPAQSPPRLPGQFYLFTQKTELNLRPGSPGAHVVQPVS